MGKVKSASFAAMAAMLLLPSAVHAQAFAVLHSFADGSDGAYPYAGLLNVSGTLFGTTEEGGTANAGTLFTINPTTGLETVVYSFAGGSDGDSPVASLLNVGGTLYGTTSGYMGGNATVFKFDPTTGIETVLHNFSGSDGAEPFAALIKVGGYLYGTTVSGGTSGQGTVFKINPTTGVETVVYSFTGGTDGGSPYAPLLDVGGKLYGTTYVGGAFANGTVFTLNPKTGIEAVLHSFQDGSSNDGAYPLAALISVGGLLYGTTEVGGSASSGTAFSINPTSGAVSVIYSFLGGNDGQYPEAALLNIKGQLYGSTVEGGDGLGTVFSINPTSGAEAVLHSFDGTDGEYIQGTIVKVGKSLYGTAYFGGASGVGAVFSQKP